jgi:hypothetical protein
MWSNHPALKLKDILTRSINSIMCLMGLSKHQEYEYLRDFLIKNDFRIDKADSTLFTQKWIKICLYAKSKLMILYLVLLTNHFVMSLAK